MNICGIRPRSFPTTLLSLFAIAVVGSLCLAGCGSASNTYSPIAKTGGVQVEPGFTIAVGPSSVGVIAGNTANYTVTITETGGFNSPITLSASNLPTGATATFGDLTPTAGGATATLAISTTVELDAADIVASKIAKSQSKIATNRIVGTGNTTFTVTAAGGGITQTATAIISITGAPDFGITLTPVATGSNIVATGRITAQRTYSHPHRIWEVSMSAPVALVASQRNPQNTTVAFGSATVTPTAAGATTTVNIVTSSSEGTTTNMGTYHADANRNGGPQLANALLRPHCGIGS